MCLILTICAALAFSGVYFYQKKNSAVSKSVFATMLMFWAASLMWSMDGVASVLEGEGFFSRHRCAVAAHLHYDRLVGDALTVVRDLDMSVGVAVLLLKRQTAAVIGGDIQLRHLGCFGGEGCCPGYCRQRHNADGAEK